MPDFAFLTRVTGRRHPRYPTNEIAFICNICGSDCVVEDRSRLQREEYTCTKCTSHVRWRSVIAALSYALYGDYLTLDEFPDNHQMVGIGTSDWEGYAMRLGRVFSYQNTFYDREPRLDLAAELPDDLAGTCDFVISSDVLEHVPPPVEAAFVNLRKLLKPGGVLILTVPMSEDGSTAEHFPELCDYQVVDHRGEPLLVNRTASGSFEVFSDLVFHGGEGATLEMRLLSYPDVVTLLSAADFAVQAFDWEVPRFGIVWNIPATWPLIARAST